MASKVKFHARKYSPYMSTPTFDKIQYESLPYKPEKKLLLPYSCFLLLNFVLLDDQTLRVK